MTHKIKFIYFDVGGVLFRWREVVVKIAEKTKKPHEEVWRAFRLYDDFSCRGEMPADEMGEKIFDALRIDKKRRFDFTGFTMQHFTPITETHEFVHTLHGRIPFGLLTNIYPGFFELSKKHGHIPDIEYHSVIQSCIVGYIKPEKEIYLQAQKKAGVPHGEILFIDDQPDNIVAAEELGWHTVHFDSDNPKKSIHEIKRKLKH